MADPPPEEPANPPLSPSHPLHTPGLRHTTLRAPSPDHSKNLFDTTPEAIIASQIREHHMKLLHGFSINELEDMGAFGNPGAKASNLHNPIHPFYRKEMWRAPKNPVLVGGGVEGSWDVENEVVWGALVPCLRLASRLLANMHLFPWLDALLNGPWKHIPKSELDFENHKRPDLLEYGAYEFSSRNNFKPSDKVQKELNDIIESVRPKVFITFDSANIRSTGRTGTVLPWRSEIRLSIGMLFAVVRGDISESERLVEQFAIAKTLVHETMHALGVEPLFGDRRRDIKPLIPPSIQNQSKGKLESEPFFEAEEVSELGTSWEKMTFGGAMGAVHNPLDSTKANDPTTRGTKIPLDLKERRALAEYISSYPSWPHYLNTGSWTQQKRHPERFGPDSTVTFWPVVASYYENIQRSEFWDVYIEALGREALRIPLIWGREIARDETRKSKRVRGREFVHYVGDGKDPYAADLPKVLPPPPGEVDEVKLWQYGEAKRVRQYAILTALRVQREEEWEREQKERWGRIEGILTAAITAFRNKNMDEAERLIKSTEECDNTRLNIIRGFLMYLFYADTPQGSLSKTEGWKARDKFLGWIELKKVNTGKPILLDGLYQKISDIFLCSKHLSAKQVEWLEGEFKRLKREEPEKWKEEIENFVSKV